MASLQIYGPFADPAVETLFRQFFRPERSDRSAPQGIRLDVAENVRAKQPWMPVLIVTGYGSDESEARAKAAGVTEFLRKPLSVGKFFMTS